MPALIFANLVPVAGILLLGWNLWSVVFAYWGESAIVGFWTVVKMIGSRRRRHEALFSVPFILAHFGLFMAVHGVFLVHFVALKLVVDARALLAEDFLSQRVEGKFPASADPPQPHSGTAWFGRAAKPPVAAGASGSAV